MKRGRLLSICLSALLFFGFIPTAASAAEPIVPEEIVSVTIDGSVQNYDPPAMVVKGRTLVPLRAIFEKLGANVLWDQDTSTVTATKGPTTISLVVGSNSATVNGKQVALDVPAALYHDRTMVPARFVGESFGYQVEWDGASKRVKIISGEKRLHTVEEIGQLADSVIQIESYYNNVMIAAGSGFIVSADGEIVTNAHVVDGADKINVKFTNGDSVSVDSALLIDETKDLALFKVNKPDLQALPIGDSTKIQLGQQVVAIGSPLGLQNTLSTGVISNKSRIIDGHEYIQISAPIDHGSSGGALFNMYGEVIGVTSAKIESSASLNLAIPSAILKDFLSQPRTLKKLSDYIKVPDSGVIQHLTVAEIEDYLNEHWGISTYNGNKFHFNFFVGNSNDNSAYIVLNNMYDSDEISTLLKLDEESPGVIAGLLWALADEVYLRSGKNVGVGLFANDESTTYPTGVPSEFITYSNGKYRYYLPIMRGVFDYERGEMTFIAGTTGTPFKKPLPKPTAK